MKRFALAALALVTLLGLTGCDLLGTTTDTPTSGGTTDIFSGTGKDGGTSQWWIKGSFDGWKGVDDQAAINSTDTIHYLSIDSLNPKLLSYEITVPTTGLRKFTYEFVLMNNGAAGSRVKFQAGETAVFSDNTPVALVASSVAKSKNVGFVASATSYTVKVDITDPAAPRIKLVPGSTPSTSYSVAELAAGMKVAGGKLSYGWTETAGTFDAATKTVTWTDVGVTDRSSPVYFHADVGYFKAASDVASPTAINGTVTAALSGSNDFNLTGVPFSDAKYKFEVIIDPTKTSFAEAFTFRATLTAGSVAWVDYAPWSTVVLNGNWDGTNWVSGVALTNNAGVWTTDIVAGTTTVNFKPGKINWDDSTNAIVQGAGSITLNDISNGGNNINFTAVSGHTYRVKVEFIGTYTSDGKPTVTVTDVTTM